MTQPDPAKGTLADEQSHHPRRFEQNLFVYPVLSRRLGGVSLGINLNLDKGCNFDCPYCQVNRREPGPREAIDVGRILAEADSFLEGVDAEGIVQWPRFASIAPERRRLLDIALSGDGEPTMVAPFPEICRSLRDLQRKREKAGFQLTLITNSTLLDRQRVQEGIAALLEHRGEVWAKLDAGTEAWYQSVNISRIPLARIIDNLHALGRRHPYKIQSLFCTLHGRGPDEAEVKAYLNHLRSLVDKGSRILEVQLHTLARKPAASHCGAVPVDFLAQLKQRIESDAGLPARVYAIED